MLQARNWLESVQLGNMTHLELSFVPVNEATLQCLAQCLRSAHEMQMVKVTAEGPAAVEAGWTQGLLGMPRQGQYEFHTVDVLIEEGRDGVAQMLKEQGFVIEESGDHVMRFNYPAGDDSSPSAAAPE